MRLNESSCVTRCVKNSMVSAEVGGGVVIPEEEGLGK